MIEIVVVIVYLGRGKLALVNNVLGGQGANVKPFSERTLVRIQKI
jgi:hypothetical protein